MKLAITIRNGVLVGAEPGKAFISLSGQSYNLLIANATTANSCYVRIVGMEKLQLFSEKMFQQLSADEKKECALINLMELLHVVNAYGMPTLYGATWHLMEILIQQIGRLPDANQLTMQKAGLSIIYAIILYKNLMDRRAIFSEHYNFLGVIASQEIYAPLISELSEDNSCYVMQLGGGSLQLISNRGFANLPTSKQFKWCKVNLLALLSMIESSSDHITTLYGFTEGLIEQVVTGMSVEEEQMTRGLYQELVAMGRIFSTDNPLLDIVFMIQGIHEPIFNMAQSNACYAMIVGENKLQLFDNNGFVKLSERQRRCCRVNLIGLLYTVHDNPGIILYGVTESLVMQVVAGMSVEEAQRIRGLYQELVAMGRIFKENYHILGIIAMDLKSVKPQDQPSIGVEEVKSQDRPY
jgi:hypothetical protein